MGPMLFAPSDRERGMVGIRNKRKEVLREMGINMMT